jgi:hypothetical protein
MRPAVDRSAGPAAAGRIGERARGIGAALGALAAYGLITIAITWPLAAHLGSAIGGEIADPWQTLWGFWWWRHSLDYGTSPMFSPLLWWPAGAPLWMQTWDIPSAIAVWPLWGRVPPVAIYNLPLLATFPLSGLTFYLLGRELWGGRLAAFLAGCLYTFSTYHLAHARMQLHLASLEWSPLFFLFLLRMNRTRRWFDAALCGAALGLATLASAYHFVLCVIGAGVLALWERRALWAARRQLIVLRQAVIAIAAFGIVAGWLLAGMARSYVEDVYVGGHEPVRFSADLQSFVLPTANAIWSRWITAAGRWTGNEFEIAAYAGLVAIGLAVKAARHTPRVRGYLAMAAVGAVLSLGPLLHVGGTVSLGLLLPEAWLELLVPPFRLSGMPARYSWLVTFGVSIAAGAALRELCARGRRGVTWAVVLTMIALAEVWPRPFVLSRFPEPPIMRAWRQEPSRQSDWAVLDATYWSRGLWHQMLHERPLTTGYLTRTPQRLWEHVHDEPALAPFLEAQFGATAAPPISPVETLGALRRSRVRFVIVDERQRELVTGVGLEERYRGAGIVVYEVPPRGA